jgi:hypothetical protein
MKKSPWRVLISVVPLAHYDNTQPGLVYITSAASAASFFFSSLALSRLLLPSPALFYIVNGGFSS